MQGRCWTLVLLLATSCSCVQINEALHKSTRNAAEPSLDLSLAIGPSSSAVKHHFNHLHKSSGGRVGQLSVHEPTQYLFPMQESPSLKQADPIIRGVDVEDARRKDWLSLGHPSSSSAAPDHASSLKRLASTPTSHLPEVPSEADAVFPMSKKSRSKKGQGVWSNYRSKQIEKQAAFWREWDNQGLGMHLSPEELAKRVRLIHVDGVISTHAGRWIHKHLEKDPDYLLRFGTAQKLLTDRITHIRRRFEKANPAFKAMPLIEQEHMIMRHVMELDAKKVTVDSWKARKYGRGAKDTLRRQKEADLITKAGQIAEAHFATFGIDPSRMTAKDLEETTRHLSLGNVSSQRFHTALNKYLRTRLGEKAQSLTYLRKKHRLAERVQERREKRRARGKGKGKMGADLHSEDAR